MFDYSGGRLSWRRAAARAVDQVHPGAHSESMRGFADSRGGGGAYLGGTPERVKGVSSGHPPFGVGQRHRQNIQVPGPSPLVRASLMGTPGSHGGCVLL